jgi:O-antigen/teichoic acid export membrane protein
MGVIQRQTLKNNALAIVGVLIGVYSQLKIYPEDLALKGMLDGVIYSAMLIAPILVFGMSSLMIRVLPYATDVKETSASRLLAMGTVVVVGVTVLVAAFNYFLGTYIFAWLMARKFDVSVFIEYNWLILGLAFLGALRAIYIAHANNFQRIALPVFFENLIPKIGVPLIVLAVVYGLVPRETSVGWQVVVYGLATLGTVVYGLATGGWKFQLKPVNLDGISRKEMGLIALFGILTTVGTRLVTYTDGLMVLSMIGKDEMAIYTFSAFVALIMNIPARAVNQVAAPIVAGHWKDQRIAEMGTLYRETSEVLFVIGAVLLTGIIILLPYVYQITDKTGQYAPGYWVAVVLGMAQLVESMTSINNSIITYTAYYRWNSVFLFALGVANVAMNFLLIRYFGLGLVGAAIASFLAIGCYNLVKVVFIWWKLGIHPFSLPQLFSAVGLVLIGAVVYSLPFPDGGVLNILFRGGLIAVLSALYFWFTSAAPNVRRIMKERTFLK